MWVDVSSPDVEKSAAFYSSLFGWDAQRVPDPQAGGYTMFYLDGKNVAAAGPTFSSEQHAAWSVYIHSEDAEATCGKVKEAGGQVVMGPMDVMGQGHMAVLQDPTGAFVSIWQPQLHTGAEVVNEVGSFCWNELYTRDISAARDFYSKVFGWETEETEMPGGTYTLFKVDGRSIAGGLDMRAMVPDHVPPHWLTYFAVKNTAETFARANELGGTGVVGPMDTPMGPMAVMSDSAGAYFAVIQAAQQ